MPLLNGPEGLDVLAQTERRPGEAEKKSGCGRFHRDFSADFKSHPHPQRPTCRYGWGCGLKDAKKIDENAPHFDFFSASEG